LKRIIGCSFVCCLILSVIPLFGLTIKLGSLAPSDSPWDKCLKQLASDWEKASSGQVIIKIYTGGTVGDEAEMIRKMRLGQLQAAAITSNGINQIYKGVLALSIPLLVNKDDELQFVLDKMSPFLDEEIAKKSFKVVVWTFAGWAHVFSKQPVSLPDDLRKQKFWVWEGNSKELQLWKEAGFHPVPLGVPDMMTSLQSGMVDAFISTPLTTASYQWFGIAKNMNEMNWAPMIAGVVINSSVWNKIPKDLQPTLLDISKKAGIQITGETVKADAEAIRVMKNYGLKTQGATAANEAEWKKVIDKYFGDFINSEIGSDSYSRVKNLLLDYRAHGKEK
jgi:TRAP-type transport system periplasmic protein